VEEGGIECGLNRDCLEGLMMRGGSMERTLGEGALKKGALEEGEERGRGGIGEEEGGKERKEERRRKEGEDWGTG